MIAPYVLPGQTDHQGLQLLWRQGKLLAHPRFAPDEVAGVQPASRQPQTETVVHQHLHAVAAFVGKQVGAVGLRFAEHLHHPGQSGIGSRAHIQGFGGQPDFLDPDHVYNDRIQGMARSILASGHLRKTGAAPSTFTTEYRRDERL